MDAFDSNWIAPVGPHIDLFEEEFATAVGRRHAVALSSGTAALHLALLLLGVGEGDSVLVPSLTFVATANAVSYTGARPVFIDSDRRTWNIDPSLVAEEMHSRARAGDLPSAVIAVDLYGQCADYPALTGVCDAYDVPIIEDAAEALGASLCGRAAGTFGNLAVFSFNGNKIITTSGGGMLVADNSDWILRARYLSAQSREPTLHYEHIDTGYNYRLSNLLAAVGRGQLRSLDVKVDRRRRTFEHYRNGLADLPGLTFMPEPAGFRSTRWLTVAMVDPAVSGVDRDTIIAALAAAAIEARPTWKPMHLQPLFRDAPMHGGAISSLIFDRGFCLPSGSGLSEGQVDRVIDVVRTAWGAV